MRDRVKKDSNSRTPPSKQSNETTTAPTEIIAPATEFAQENDRAISPQSVLHLQQTIGNQGVKRLLAQRQADLQRVTDAPAAENTQPTVQPGSSGQAVTSLQEKLNSAGTTPPLVTDGIFGPLTRAAVVAFQSQNGLAADGIVGPATWAKLNGTPGAEATQEESTENEGAEATEERATEEPTEEQATETPDNLEDFLQNQVITQSGERFDIVYMPSDVSGPEARPVLGRAIFVLKLHLTFLNADDTPVQEPELSAGGADARDQVWSEEEQDQFRQNLASSIETAWSGQHLIECVSPGFEPLKTGVEIDVQFVNDPGSAHNKMTVHKRGTQENGKPQERFRSFVQGDRSEFDSRDPTEEETFNVFKLNRFTGSFEHGKSELTPEMTGQLDSIADEINALPEPVGEDGSPGPHEVEVTGRATASGSDEFNEGLSQERADNVVTYLSDKVDSADFTARAEGEVGPGDSTRSNEDPKYRRADIRVDRFTSELNTAAHEAGHMFGLGDEYVDMDEDVRRLIGEADSPADPDLLNDEFAEIPAGNTDSIMSMGSVVHEAHYAPFALKLERATNLEWTIP